MSNFKYLFWKCFVHKLLCKYNYRDIYGSRYFIDLFRRLEEFAEPFGDMLGVLQPVSLLKYNLFFCVPLSILRHDLFI